MGLTGASGIVQVHPSRRCNLRCRHCYSSSGPSVSDATDVDVLFRAVADAGGLGYDVVAVSGGEPLLFPELLPLLRHAKACGLRTAVTTNGLLLTGRRLAELRGLVDVLAISLDGGPETHNWIRGDARAYGHLARRLPALRDSGTAFAFITTLTLHNAHELEFVFEQAAEHGAALVQVHPLEPEGFGADLRSSVPDSTELGFAFVEATRLSLIHRIPVQVDLVTQKDLRTAPGRFFIEPPDQRDPPGSWLSPLVIETDGTVVPLSYGFGRDYALGNVHHDTLSTLWERWDGEPLHQLARELYDDLVADGVAFANWYERMTHRSTSTPARSARRP